MKHTTEHIVTLASSFYTCDVNTEHRLLDGQKPWVCEICGVEMCGACLQQINIVATTLFTCPPCREIRVNYVNQWDDLYRAYVASVEAIRADWKQASKEGNHGNKT